MSSLTLIEIRIPQYATDGRNLPDATVTAEWFKAYAGVMQLQYRVVGGGNTLYFADAGKAVAAATARARRAFKAMQ